MYRVHIILRQEYGLEINLAKSNIIIFNMKEKQSQIEGIRVVKEIKYLGVTANDNINCFKTHITNITRKAQTLANQVSSIISKSCNKIIIGKTFWKSVALYGLDVVYLNKAETRNFQKIENRV